MAFASETESIAHGSVTHQPYSFRLFWQQHLLANIHEHMFVLCYLGPSSRRRCAKTPHNNTLFDRWLWRGAHRQDSSAL